MRRVVSLVPSATEWLFAMGAADCVVGRSHECDWPAQATHLPVLTAPRTTATDPAHVDAQVSAAMDAVGSLYHLDRNALVALAPDVVVVQDACGVCSIDVPTVQGALAEAGLDTTLVTLRPHTIEDIFDDILTLGEAVNRHDAAQRVMVDMRARWWSIHTSTVRGRRSSNGQIRCMWQDTGRRSSSRPPVVVSRSLPQAKRHASSTAKHSLLNRSNGSSSRLVVCHWTQPSRTSSDCNPPRGGRCSLQ